VIDTFAELTDELCDRLLARSKSIAVI
jgi:hypothetical protein